MKQLDGKTGERYFNARVFILGIFFTVTISLLLADLNTFSKATVSIMLIPRSQAVADNITDIAADARELPKTLSFYERLLADNPRINDFTQGHSADERKELWNTYVQVADRQEKSGTIIDISLYAKKQADAQTLSQETARTLFTVMSHYYDIRTELDMRLVDGPIVSAMVKGLGWIIPLSIILGFLCAFLVSVLTENLFAFRHVFHGPKVKGALQGMAESESVLKKNAPASIEELYLPEELAIMKNVQKNTEKKVSAIPAETLLVQQEVSPEEMQKMQYPNFPEMPLGHELGAAKGGGAPDNLPVFDDASLQFGAPQAEPVQEVTEEVVEAPIVQTPKAHEPTQEEIKRRLNALLSGKM